MNYNRELYVGRKIQLFPGDTHAKFAIIDDVDDLGWRFKMIEPTSSRATGYQVGSVVFINHAKNIIFTFLD